jgi:hypothetical protein
MTKGRAFLAVMAGMAAGAVIGMLFKQSNREIIKELVLKRKAGLADLISRKIDARFDEIREELSTRRSVKIQNGSEMVGKT